MPQRIIGITGLAGSGKDTVAAYLKASFNFETVAFAEPIRDGMRAMFGLEDKHFQHPGKEVVLPEFGKSPRQMMQTLGTQYGRDCVNKDLWLILAGKKISTLHSKGFNVALTDVRFENEAEYVRKAGGVVWHVSRAVAGTPHAHASEAGVAFVDGDGVIDNNGSLLGLYMQVDELWGEAQ